MSEAMDKIETIIATPGSMTPESPTGSSPSSAFSPPLPDHSDNMRHKEKQLTFPEADGELLLPGIPNDITFTHIATKLGWRDFYMLAAVSPAWCHGIRSRQIYDARVRSLSTEKLVLSCSGRSGTSGAIDLYSRTDSAWYKLPSIPKLDKGSPCRCVALNGNIYLFGVVEQHSVNRIKRSFVFDLAGQRQWQKCEDQRPLNSIASSYVFDLAGQLRGPNCEGIVQLRHPFDFEPRVLDEEIYVSVRSRRAIETARSLCVELDVSV